MTWTGNTSPGFPPAARKLILERDPICTCDRDCPEHRGQPCRLPSTDADHKITPADGGTNHPDNGRGLCRRCHQWRTQDQARTQRRTQRRPAERHPGLR